MDAVTAYGLSPVRITPLPEAKHIFSHVEWQMRGWMVLVEELEPGRENELIYVEPARTEQEFPIPAAFAAYAACLSIRIGQEGFEEKNQ